MKKTKLKFYLKAIGRLIHIWLKNFFKGFKFLSRLFATDEVVVQIRLILRLKKYWSLKQWLLCFLLLFKWKPKRLVPILAIERPVRTIALRSIKLKRVKQKSSKYISFRQRSVHSYSDGVRYWRTETIYRPILVTKVPRKPIDYRVSATPVED